MGYAAVVEHRLANGMRGHQFQPLRVVETSRALLDDEGRQAAAALAGVGLGEDGVGGGVAGLADEFLASVQHPVVTVGRSLGGHADDVGASVGFGEGEGGDGLAPGDGREVAGLLLVGAAEDDGIAAQSLHDEVCVGLRRHPRQFLADDAEVHDPNAVAAVLLGHGVAQ